MDAIANVGNTEEKNSEEPIFIKNGKLCSKTCIEPAYVTFVNYTSCKVRIYWLDYDGNKRLYNKIGPKEFLEVNTFVTHLWIFENDLTGDRLLGERSFVFRPASFQIIRRLGDIRLAMRRVVPIRYPMLSLKNRALQVIRDLIKNVDDVEDLELPNSLKCDLQLFIKQKLCTSDHAPNCSCLGGKLLFQFIPQTSQPQCLHSYLYRKFKA